MVPMMVSRTLSIPVCEAASISCTSIERLSDISLHEGQASGSSVRQGVAVGCFLFWRINGFPRQAGGVGFGGPRRPRKRDAWGSVLGLVAGGCVLQLRLWS